MNNYRVRFAVPLSPSHYNQKCEERILKDNQTSDLECDCIFPVCQNCILRSVSYSPAISTPREYRWRVESPSSTLYSQRPRRNLRGLRTRSLQTFRNADIDNDNILQHWFHHTSRIMVVDATEENPFSFPLTTYLSHSKSLIHILKSVSLAHQHFFRAEKLIHSLEERCKAIEACRNELSLSHQPMQLHFLTVYFLGLSASYMDNSVCDFGKEHLFAARAIVDIILSTDVFRTNSLTRLIMGAFIHWDMSCTILIDSSEQRSIDTPLIESYIQEMSHLPHPITGRSTKIFFLLCRLGRYLRAVLEDQHHDTSFEMTIEQELLDWNSDKDDPMWFRTGEAFRKHGLIILSHIRSRDVPLHVTREDLFTNSRFDSSDLYRRCLALDIIHLLLKIPPESPHVALQLTPLLSAGTELMNEDMALRLQVLERLKAINSFNRLPNSLFVVKLIEDLWAIRDQGHCHLWQELLLSRKWMLRIF